MAGSWAIRRRREQILAWIDRLFSDNRAGVWERKNRRDREGGNDEWGGFSGRKGMK